MYNFNSDDVYRFADHIGAQTHTKGNELVFKYCPYCEGGQKDKETFSVNLETGAFNCFRASCGKQGHFVQLAKDFNFYLDGYEKPTPRKPNYKTMPQKEITVRSEALEYLKKRCISEEIGRRYKITTRTDKRNILVFPFYDEKGVLTCAKYRKTDFDKTKDRNKEWFEAGTKPILFGMAQADDFTKPLIITEGQLDSLSVASAGFPNAVSVPTGAKGFTWVQYCFKWVQNFPEILVFGDWEKGKMSLLDEIQKRFKMRVRAVREEDYKGKKDANDILKAYGAEAVRQAVENAELIKIDRVKPLETVKSVDISQMPKIRSGFPEIDKVIGGFYLGQVIVLSGRRGEGKSTFMSQLIPNAIEQGYKAFVYSGELPDFHFKRWIDLQIASDNLIRYTDSCGNEQAVITDTEQAKVNSWYAGKIFLYDNSLVFDDKETRSESKILLETIEKVIRQYDVKLICIDNLMTAVDCDNASELYRKQSQFVGKLKRLATEFEVAVILVAHPRKSANTSIENDDVSGSADITNKVDVVMSYLRNTKKTDETAELPDSSLQISKNRLTGKLVVGKKSIDFWFDPVSKRVATLSTLNKHYPYKECPDVHLSEELSPPF